jgi:hypothetical protein
MTNKIKIFDFRTVMPIVNVFIINLLKQAKS